MKEILALCIFAASLGISTAPSAFAAGSAQERAAHFEAKHADTVDDAVTHLKEANAKLAELLAGKVDDHAMHDIHSLSYTIEESIQRIMAELQMLHDTAADMHFATEGLKRDAAIDYGEAYLDGIGKIIP